jgi:hypothetical protein
VSALEQVLAAPESAARRPKLAPGARLAWTQVHQNGTVTERTGIVWSLAPVIGGHESVWLIPDQSLSTDPYPGAVMVLRLPVQRSKVVGEDLCRYRLPAGSAYSEDDSRSVTGGYGAAMARNSAAHKLYEEVYR